MCLFQNSTPQPGETAIPPRCWWFERITLAVVLAALALTVLRWWWGVAAHTALRDAVDRFVPMVERTYREWGAHAQLVLGIWINRIPDENCAENLYHMAANTRGYWIYDLMSLAKMPCAANMLT